MSSVVITGIGLVTPLGLGREKSWDELLLGHSAVKSDYQLGGFLSAKLPDLDVPPETRMLSMSFLAAAEAISDSGMDPHAYDFSRFGCTLSVSKPNILSTDGMTRFSDLFYQSATGRQTASIFRLAGPLMNVSAACATGAVSIVTAVRWIESGICDMTLAGAVESPFSPLYAAGFGQMGVLAKNSARPFDANREGFALAEGACVLILERKDRAVLRGAGIYGEVSGWGLSNDTINAVTYDPAGRSISLAVEKALGMSKDRKIDYVHVHGTGTRINDAMETKAYERVFGRKAPGVSFSSTKAATGHMLGASGAAGTAFALLAMRDNAVPPTLNLITPDPECGLDYTPLVTAEKEVSSAMAVSFGFGGQTAVVCFRKL